MAGKKPITKEDLAEQLVKDGKMQKKDAIAAIEIIFADIAKDLVDGDAGTVKIAGFGTFTLIERKARTGVNPANTAEKIDIPASRAVKFKPSKTLKDFVNSK
jgi:DNA-binding protein HU-beta